MFHVLVPLTLGQVALVDHVDVPLIGGRRWQASRKMCSSGGHYARRTRPEGGSEAMHRLIMSPPDDMMVDHINGDGLDNRRCNLRIADKYQNRWNSVKGGPGASKSGFRGVTLMTDQVRTRPYRALIMVDAKNVALGYYATAAEAAAAYDAAATAHYGEYAKLNFPRLAA